MKKRFILLTISILSSIWLSACAITDNLGSRVAAGSAKYTYSRSMPDGSKCQVDILSARDVVGGTLHINPDCSIDSSAEQTKGAEAAMQAVNTALELLKNVAAAAK